MKQGCMSHSHDHSHHHHHSTGNIRVAFFLNLGFTLIEIVGDLLTNSVAILSDAVHDLGDSLSLGLSWYFQSLSGKKATATFSFGYRRFSLLGALINSVMLIVGGVLVLQEAIPRLMDPMQPEAEGMIYLAILGVVVNGAAVLRLKKGSSMNEKVVSLHLLEDVLGWVAVLIAAIVMQFADVPILDPLLSVLITAWVLWNAFRNLRKCFVILLQAVPEDKDIRTLKTRIEALPGVASIHDIHLWTLDGEKDIFTVHIKVPPHYTLEQVAGIKDSIREVLAEEHIEHVTIEVESQEEECAQVDC